MKGPGGEVDSADEFAGDESWHVETVDKDGVAKITMATRRMRFKTRSPKEQFEVDTEGKTESLPPDSAFRTRLLREMIHNLKVHFAVDRRGRLTEVKVEKAGNRHTMAAAAAFSQWVSEQKVAERLKQMLLVFPDAPLAPGDKWNDTLKNSHFPHEGFTNILVTYRYAGSIHYKGRIVEKIDEAAATDGNEEKLPPGVKLKTASQDNTGTVYFDNAAGYLLEAETTQKKTRVFSKEDYTIREQSRMVSKIQIDTAP